MPTLNVEAFPSILQTEVAHQPQTRAADDALSRSLVRSAALLMISVVAIAINGYHPYAEDAGIYVAGIKQAVHPGLYGASAVFITASSHMSQFSYLNAMLTRSLSLPLDDQLFATQVFTTWLLLFACWRIAQRCFSTAEARWASVSLVAACLSVPVAGSSLFMMDPYVTGRSFSTPLTLFAIDACLEGKMLRSFLLLGLVAMFHPLMSIYAAGFVLLLWAARAGSWIGTVSLMISALAAGWVVQLSQRAVSESPAYRAAVATRPYFFLVDWKWYEIFGLAAPLALLGAYWLWRRRSLKPLAELNEDDRVDPGEGGVLLARTCVAIGCTSIAVSLLFVYPQSHSHLLAAMQPMRVFVLVYLFLFLLLGGFLGEVLLKRVAWRWAPLFLAVGGGVAFAQHESYPDVRHLELPGLHSQNGWNRAFVWIRSATPLDAIFALDCDYIHAPGEDAQGFRAIAERGSLADFSKDGGAAAVFPQLAERWLSEHRAETGLNAIDDAERLRRLLPLHASWMVLDRHATTAMPCPFEDDAVKVCRLQ